MLEDWVIDCWWESLLVTLWTWKQVIWRSIQLHQVCLNLNVVRMLTSLLLIVLSPFSPHKKKKKEREKREEERMWSPHKLQRGRDNPILLLLSLQEVRNKIRLSRANVINHIEVRVPPLSSLLSSFLQSHEYRECSCGTEGSRECQSHFRSERTWYFEGKTQSSLLEVVLTLYWHRDPGESQGPVSKAKEIH